MSFDTNPTELREFKNLITALYDDGSLYYKHEELAKKLDLSGNKSVKQRFQKFDSKIRSPFVVTDPRFLGYKFPSYTFVETERNLEDGFRAESTHFDRPDDALFLGTVLGDYDLIHRRLDRNRWQNANFAKWAKDRLSYFEEFETYPIFQIARWYGKDRNSPIKEQSGVRKLDEVEKDLIIALNQDTDFLTKVNQYIEDDTELELSDISEELAEYDDYLVRDKITNLKEEEILLGSSVTYDINNSPWNSVVMGISLGGERREGGDEEGSPRMNLEVDHDSVIEELQSLNTEYIDNFTLPFITSGIGQGWGDILLELRVEDVHHMDSIAQEIRDIEYVTTTQSYMLTDVLLNKPPQTCKTD